MLSSQVFSLEKLPNEIIEKVLLQMKYQNLVRLSRTSSRFRNFILQDKNFWKQKFEIDFPPEKTLRFGNDVEPKEKYIANLYILQKGVIEDEEFLENGFGEEIEVNIDEKFEEKWDETSPYRRELGEIEEERRKNISSLYSQIAEAYSNPELSDFAKSEIEREIKIKISELEEDEKIEQKLEELEELAMKDESDIDDLKIREFLKIVSNMKYLFLVQDTRITLYLGFAQQIQSIPRKCEVGKLVFLRPSFVPASLDKITSSELRVEKFYQFNRSQNYQLSIQDQLNQIWNMNFLRSLFLSEIEGLYSIRGIGNLLSLKKLYLRYLYDLQDIPDEIEDLNVLDELYISFVPIGIITPSLSRLITRMSQQGKFVEISNIESEIPHRPRNQFEEMEIKTISEAISEQFMI
jgi:hypothetical protein